MKKLHPFVRKLHLYFGLFISPFIVSYSLGVLTFNHDGLLKRYAPVTQLPEIRTKLDKIPRDKSDLAVARAICEKLNIDGEIDFISRNKDYISFPVSKPGLKTMVNINARNDSVFITREQQGSLRAMGYLHKMPGPHNQSIRGNSLFLSIWRVITNGVVYILLFLTVSGVFLWYFLKIERNMGLFAIVLGALCITGLLILII